jgi:hypothetical protein
MEMIKKTLNLAEIKEVKHRYPETKFNNEQVAEFLNGKAYGLSFEQIDSIAFPGLPANQMKEAIEGLIHGIPLQAIASYAAPALKPYINGEHSPEYLPPRKDENGGYSVDAYSFNQIKMLHQIKQYFPLPEEIMNVVENPLLSSNEMLAIAQNCKQGHSLEAIANLGFNRLNYILESENTLSKTSEIEADVLDSDSVSIPSSNDSGISTPNMDTPNDDDFGH